MTADQGLQVERTSLASTRTYLSILALAAGCLRWLPRTAVAISVVVGLVVAGLAFAEWRGRSGRAEQFADEHVVPSLTASALLAISVVSLSIAGLWRLFV
ncbi:DUF202 domain-containing protein [Antrihabitans cavernicola]|uniref:DUF202 domain-containing protein n=1 Tax=Antrihabitans cavernicola TaxID=2495913 RepID=A0A5A7SJR5_9NOCA|nr:DUF202 domain-containing protein [Spelaeibacter cavernicola]KAA0024893.1 DUF202 domain-containing protein [Spelaeibacter cavernicola]